jgi:hypothetical protein
MGETLRDISPETFWLLAWSLGGLVVMSFVPSKRIDRIFPIVPPLCLLVAAVVGRCRQRESWRQAVDRSCAAAIMFAVVFATGYTAHKIVVAGREQRDAFAAFGRAVVMEAASHGWRHAIVGGDDEGMLLYVRRMDFLEPEEAAVRWNAGRVDALVVPEDELENLLPRLGGGQPKKHLSSQPAGRDARRYFLLVRPGSS